MEREAIFEYAKKVYGTVPEYLWEQYPDCTVLRAKDTKKWYAVIMKVAKEKLGMNDSGEAEVINCRGTIRQKARISCFQRRKR